MSERRIAQRYRQYWSVIRWKLVDKRTYVKHRKHQDVCSATHVGSPGAMEVNAAVKLWERSESIGFRYRILLSDGDSKSFLELKERDVYGSEAQIKKEECINHVSKRLRTALR
ncbi:uncharacterized protein TNCV_4977401 [Trichonephila clavipes]|nr:uncharacterized protein TNCV_4977401 [Trichonephila clavipes]